MAPVVGKTEPRKVQWPWASRATPGVVSTTGRRLAAFDPLRRFPLTVKASGIEDGAVFRPIKRHGQVGNVRLPSEVVACIVKRYVKKIGLDAGEYSGHSLRAGFVTSAARARAAVWQIRKQTGHKSNEVLAGYSRDSGKFADSAAPLILGSRSKSSAIREKQD